MLLPDPLSWPEFLLFLLIQKNSHSSGSVSTNVFFLRVCKPSEIFTKT